VREKYREIIESFTYEAAKLMKAIRLVQALANNVPGSFPIPDNIRPGRKPYDLKLEWEAVNIAQQDSLRAHIVNNLRLRGIKWNKAMDKAIICSSRVKVGVKDTLNVRFRVALRGQAPISS
jgi:hypothetical protein